MPITAYLDLGCWGFSAVMLGMFYFREDYFRALGLLLEFVDGFFDVLLDDVVAEHDDHPVAGGEVISEPEGLGDSARLLLIGVVEVLEAEFVAIADEPEEIAGTVSSRDQDDVLYPGVDQGLQGVVNHGLVVDGQEMLVRDCG